MVSENVLPVNKLSAGYGTKWMGESWKVFIAQPVLWIISTFLFTLLAGTIFALPLVGSIIMCMLLPHFSVGFSSLAHKICQGEKAEFSDLFCGFNAKFVPLLCCGGLAAFFFVLVPLLFYGFISAMFVVSQSLSLAMLSGLDFSSMLALVVLWLPIFSILFILHLAWQMIVSLFFLYSPMYIFLTNYSLGTALSQSLKMCLANIIPLSVSSIYFFFIFLLTIMTFGLAYFVLFPLLAIWVYISFRDILGHSSDDNWKTNFLPVNKLEPISSNTEQNDTEQKGTDQKDSERKDA